MCLLQHPQKKKNVKCPICGEVGHPASYNGCSKAQQQNNYNKQKANNFLTPPILHKTAVQVIGELELTYHTSSFR